MIIEMHDLHLTGQADIDKNRELVEECSYWPRMAKDVRK